MSVAPLRHRIFLAPGRPGVAPADVHGHWCEHHAGLMRGLPHLLGYVQNRPLASWWAQLGYAACSELWFADRERERAAFDSPWYREQITRDELRTFARDDAWSAVVTAVEPLAEGPAAGFRALAFGGAVELLDGTLPGSRVDLLRLARPAPGTVAPVVVSAWCAQEAQARFLAQRLGGIAFVAEAAPVVVPPVAPWAA